MSEKTEKAPGKSGKRVGEVASECGYGDATYSRRIFMEKVGMTPSQFRKRH